MRESFVACIGGAYSERDLEQALAQVNRNYDCTVKVLSGGDDDEALFGKIVLDSYARDRDPDIGDGIMNVGGFDLKLLHDAATGLVGGRYDPKDRDSDQRIARLAFADFDTDAFNLLSKRMPFSAVFYDTARRRLVAGRGEDLGLGECYANLFYGTGLRGGTLFSNNEALLAQFCPEVFPVDPFTYYDSGDDALSGLAGAIRDGRANTGGQDVRAGQGDGSSNDGRGTGDRGANGNGASGNGTTSTNTGTITSTNTGGNGGLPGTFVRYKDTERPCTDAAGIRANYANARDIISLVNGLLEQSANDTLKATASRLFDEYFASLDPAQRVADYVEGAFESDLRGQVASLIDERIDALCCADKVDEELAARYRALLDSFLQKEATPQVNIVKLGEVELARTQPAYFHEKFEQVLAQVQLDEPVMLIGPAGSGKNFAVAQIAEGLGLPMYYTNNASNEFKLTGFIDAGGSYHETEFYKAFKGGGIFFLDEIDNSDPSALIVINSALANGYMAFPHETIGRHPDFRCVSAANTWGKGSNLQYVGRNVLDGATLDRFDMVFFDYDRRLERALYPSDDLLEFMWAFRDAVDACRVPHIVSTRAIGKCFKKERYGMDAEAILRTNVIRGLAQDDLTIVIGAMKGIDESNPYYATITTLRVDQ